MKQEKAIALPLAVSIIAISFAAVFVKMSSAPSSILSMYRLWIIVVLMLPIVWRKREEFRRIQKRDWIFLIGSGFFLALHFLLWFASLKFTTVASSTIILALQPIISLIGGFFLFKERTTYSAVVTMGIAILGVMCIGWGDLGLSEQAIIGDILSFLSVIAVVGYLFIGQTTVKKVSHWIYSFTVFAFAGIFIAIYNVVMSVPFTGYSTWDWWIFILLAMVPTASHMINNWLLNYVNATTISMSILGEPVGASILAFFLLGEKLNSMQVIGSVLVLCGVSIFLLQQQRGVSKEPVNGAVYTQDL
ncbi:EamA family transporter [Bacillus pseudomycoides]|uniref:EamA family transporter n=1 Tax=Bacillus pseudomycoides TaxID=64104 RepID=A0AA91V7U3_9BACI|nr:MULTISPECIES: DMT family transporter [Bacillus]PEB52864.1 EamA family transporter [Bacillus sp. AFS098217]PED79924.1 EamA family transporter [Bacillus pseudomycoides]PEU07917.1 EamA family transporter [Bacillus sp. AFS019443]PEU16611.1 EamA family transporter [Bacillus sp. AFS014408]PFW64195.1 EamA family transporter [Bacillus sp. AFS075034]